MLPDDIQSWVIDMASSGLTVVALLVVQARIWPFFSFTPRRDANAALALCVISGGLSPYSGRPCGRASLADLNDCRVSACRARAGHILRTAPQGATRNRRRRRASSSRAAAHSATVAKALTFAYVALSRLTMRGLRPSSLDMTSTPFFTLEKSVFLPLQHHTAPAPPPEHPEQKASFV